MGAWRRWFRAEQINTPTVCQGHSGLEMQPRGVAALPGWNPDGHCSPVGNVPLPVALSCHLRGENGI